MDELGEILSRLASDATFDFGDFAISSADVRAGYEERTQFPPYWATATEENLKVDDRELSALVHRLGKLLEDFVEPSSQRIGNGLFSLFGGYVQSALPSVERYARIITVAATKIGAEPTTELLYGWLDGKPLRIREHAILGGVTAKDLLQCDGVDIAPLKSKGLPDRLTYPLLQWDLVPMTYEPAILTILCEQTPALFKPNENEVWSDIDGRKRYEAANPLLNSFSMDEFCDSVALAFGGFVGWWAKWRDAGPLEAFGSAGFSVVSEPEKRGWGAEVIGQEVLDKALEIEAMRKIRIKGGSPVELAIRRWVESTRQKPLSDKLIDLRIALEALYTEGGRSEKRYRTAVHGALHAGETFEKRLKYHSMLKGFYDDASAAIHAETIEDKEAKIKRLETAQHIGRKSILKVIEDGGIPNWTEIVLRKT